MYGTIPPLPQYAFMAWCSAKAQIQFNLMQTSHLHTTITFTSKLNPVYGFVHHTSITGGRELKSMKVG